MTARLRAGEAAEAAWCALMEAHGWPSWRTEGKPARKWLPDGRGITIPLGHDLLGFDCLSITPFGVVLAQIKSEHAYVAPDKRWRAGFLILPHPPGLLYLWCWWEGWQAWRVERLLPGGERRRISWPPDEGQGAA